MAALLCAFPFVQTAGHAQEQVFITIGTGGVTGVYYPSGRAVCQMVNKERARHGVRCSAEATLGSVANIEQIRSAILDFGFVQSDWQHHAYHGTSAFEEDGPFEQLRSVASLHSEVATIVVRADSAFLEFDGLKSAKVNVGGKGSGSQASWEALISRLGWETKDLQHVSYLKTSELADALCTGEIDAYFELIGHPASLIEETQAQCAIRLIGIESKAVDALLREAPYYVNAAIPAELYGFRDPVASFGVVATIVTSANMPETIAYTLVEAVVEHFESFKRLDPALNRLTLDGIVSDRMPAPLHPGALKFFQEQGLLPANSQAQ
ncbi:TAXI family TRAP transporter solute-binding subunit [Roseibium salinum]